MRFCPDCGEPVAYDDAPAVEQRRYTRRELRELSRQNPDEYYFTPDSYGETQPYSGAPRGESRYDDVTEQVTRRKNRAPYTAVCVMMALLSALNFLFPFLKCFTVNISVMGYQMSDGGFSIYELVLRFFRSENILTFLTDAENDYGLSAYLPDSLGSAYSLMRIAVTVIAGVYILTLLLWFVFFILGLSRSKGASGFGISAALITVLADAGLVWMMNYFTSEVSSRLSAIPFVASDFSVTATPLVTLSIALSAVIFILCIVAAVLRR